MKSLQLFSSFFPGRTWQHCSGGNVEDERRRRIPRITGAVYDHPLDGLRQPRPSETTRIGILQQPVSFINPCRRRTCGRGQLFFSHSPRNGFRRKFSMSHRQVSQDFFSPSFWMFYSCARGKKTFWRRRKLRRQNGFFSFFIMYCVQNLVLLPAPLSRQKLFLPLLNKRARKEGGGIPLLCWTLQTNTHA